jgi:hypothetical protein
LKQWILTMMGFSITWLCQQLKPNVKSDWLTSIGPVPEVSSTEVLPVQERQPSLKTTSPRWTKMSSSQQPSTSTPTLTQEPFKEYYKPTSASL